MYASISKRWPGKYAIKATIYAPSGRALDIETDLPTELAEKFIEEVTRYMSVPAKEKKP